MDSPWTTRGGRVALGLLVAWTIVCVLAGIGLEAAILGLFMDKGRAREVVAVSFSTLLWWGGLWVGTSSTSLRKWLDGMDRLGR